MVDAAHGPTSEYAQRLESDRQAKNAERRAKAEKLNKARTEKQNDAGVAFRQGIIDLMMKAEGFAKGVNALPDTIRFQYNQLLARGENAVIDVKRGVHETNLAAAKKTEGFLGGLAGRMHARMDEMKARSQDAKVRKQEKYAARVDKEEQKLEQRIAKLQTELAKKRERKEEHNEAAENFRDEAELLRLQRDHHRKNTDWFKRPIKSISTAMA